MTTFRYQAARPDGITVRGVLDGDSVPHVTSQLSARGLFPVLVEPHQPSSGWRSRRGSTRGLPIVFRSLASFVEAGVPLEKALQAVQRVASGPLAEPLSRVATRVREGATLGAALAAEGGLFSGVTIGLVRAGERGIGIWAGLDQAAAQLEREAEASSRIRGALAYPALLACVGTISVAVIVGFVVPRFAALLGDLGQSLPPATRLLIAVSTFVQRFGLVLGGSLIAAITLSAHYARERRVAWHGWLLQVPLIGTIRHAIASARATRTLGALLGVGTPALAALAIAGDAAGDSAVASRLADARRRVAEGAPLSMALSGTGALTETALQLLAVGEGSGRLPGLLAKAADLDDRDAERRLTALVTFLEPALILMFAALVAFVAAALLQAVYSLRPGGV